MSGGLGLKREEAAATANFRGSCSSEKQEARGRGLWTELPSRGRGRSEGMGWTGGTGGHADRPKPEDASEGVTPAQE